MTESEFKLPAASYERLTRIIIAYSHLKEPALLDEVSQRSGIDRTEISRNTAFLASCGIITDDAQRKGPTELGTLLGRALEYGLEGEVRNLLTQIIDETSFFSKILSALRVRGGMSTDNLLSHIAYMAGQKKNNRTLAGAGTLVRILELSGRARDENGTIVATREGQSDAAFSTHDTPSEAIISSAPTKGTDDSTRVLADQEGMVANVSLSININVDGATLEDLAKFLPRIIASAKAAGTEIMLTNGTGAETENRE